MIRRIITTVGTSIIGKFNEDSSELSQEFRRLEKEPLSKWSSYSKKINEYKVALLDFLKEQKDKASAEVKSLNKIIEQYPNDDIEIYLLATDTILSRMAAEVVEEYYKDKNVTVYFSLKKDKEQEYIIKGLQVKNFAELDENGFANLINAVQKIAKRRSSEIQYVLNVTGGYKATIPILTILGQVMDISVNYIYEDSDELIEIEIMPIGIDWGIAEELTPYINERGYIENDKNQLVVGNISPEIIEKLKKYKLIKDSTKSGLTYEVTGWGHVFRQYVETNMSISEKNTTSHIVEYKMYEYFQNNAYESNEIFYDTPKVGIDILRPDSTPEKKRNFGEIDILLYDNKNGIDDYDNYVTIEVKAIGTVLGALGKVKRQLTANQLAHFINKFGKDPNEVHYIIYQMFNGVDKNNPDFVEKIEVLKEAVYNHNPNIKFKAFLFTIGDPTDEKVYQNLFRRTIKPNDLQEIPIP